MEKQVLRAGKKKHEGIALLEFAIVAPLLFLIVLGMIDLFRYLYLANVLDARAQQALEFASWVPDLDKPDASSDPSANSKFGTAIKRIRQNVLSSEISSLFRTEEGGYSNASLLDVQSEYPDFKILNEGRDDDKKKFLDSEKGIVLALPPVREGSNTREYYLAKNPIGVRINAQLNPLTPFLPPIRIHGEAWGFRETNTNSQRAPMIDCLGNAYDPKNLPTPEECCISVAGEVNNGINPDTGLCGCPEGKIYGLIVGSTPPTKGCVCDLSKIICENGKSLKDPSNAARTANLTDCTCASDACYQPWGWNNSTTGQARDNEDPSKCSCDQAHYFSQGPAGSPASPPASGGTSCNYDAAKDCSTFTTHTGIKYLKCQNGNTPNCKPSCPPRSTYSSNLCGCYCEGGNDLAPPEGCPGCGPGAKDFGDPNGRTSCRCVKDLTGIDCKANPSACEPGSSENTQIPNWNDEKGVLIPGTCTYECKDRLYWSGTSYQQVTDPSTGKKTCQCANGYSKVTRSDGTPTPLCCADNLCSLGEWAGASNTMVFSNNVCGCICKPGYTKYQIDTCCMPNIDPSDPTKLDIRHCGNSNPCYTEQSVDRHPDRKIKSPIAQPSGFRRRFDCFLPNQCSPNSGEYCKNA